MHTSSTALGGRGHFIAAFGQGVVKYLSISTIKGSVTIGELSLG